MVAKILLIICNHILPRPKVNSSQLRSSLDNVDSCLVRVFKDDGMAFNTLELCLQSLQIFLEGKGNFVSKDLNSPYQVWSDVKLSSPSL